MKLPGDGDRIGPSDIIAVRECPRRASIGFERWGEEGEHPEAQSPAAAYGQAFHDAVEFLAKNEDAVDDAAVGHAFSKWFDWLQPDDTERLRKDIATYRDRDMTGVRLIGAELELEVPILHRDGKVIFLRGRIDRLYQSLDTPSKFYMQDFKTGAQPKSQAEVDEDVQFWIYAALIRACYPEAEDVEQIYDQLQFGQIRTSKSADECNRIIDWAKLQITAIMDFAEVGRDGRPKPKLNRWCGSCSYAADCPVLDRATQFTKAEIAALAPESEDGIPDVNRLNIAEYSAMLSDMKASQKLLGNVIDRVNAVLMDMATSERKALGFKIQGRSNTVFGYDALKKAREEMSEAEFLRAVKMTAASLKSSGADDIVVEQVTSLSEKKAGRGFIVPLKKG